MYKVKTYKIILIVVLLLLVVGITYGFFASQIASGAFSNILVGTSSTDSLTFSKGNDINIVATQQNFLENGTNLEDSTIASAKLIANNDTKTATKYYSLSLEIIENNYEYTSNLTPELLLVVLDPAGNPITSINGLNYTTSGGITGFDITTRKETIYIKNKEITTTNYTIGLTENWTIKIYFINLNSNQYANAGKIFRGSLNIKSVDKTTLNSNNENIIANNPNEKYLTNLKIHGNSFQNIMPSPNTPSDIVSLGNTSKIDITNSGKNIFNINTMNFTGTKKLENDILSINDGIYDRILYKQYWEPKKSTDYTIVIDVLENTFDNYLSFVSDSRFYFENIRSNIPVGFIGRKIINVKTRADYSSVTIGSIWFNSTNKIKGTFKCKLMIIEGFLTDSSTIGPYESYRDDSKTTINLNNHEPLRSLGDISDYIDYENNRIIRNVGTKTFDGSEVWNKENYNFWTEIFSLGAANNF